MKAYKKASVNLFSNTAIQPELARLKTEYINTNEVLSSIDKSAEKFFRVQYNNLNTALGIAEDETTPRIALKNEDGTHKLLTKSEYADKFKKEALGNAGYKGDILNTSPRYPLYLKDPRDNVWKKVENGEVKPYVNMVNKHNKIITIVNPELISETDIRGQGSTRKILRKDANFELGQFFAKYPHPTEKHLDFRKVHYRGWGEPMTISQWRFKDKVKTQAFQLQKPSGFRKLTNEETQKVSNSVYDKQYEVLDKINRGTYIQPGEGDSKQYSFEHVNLIADMYKISDPYAEMADLFIGRGIKYKLDDSQHKDIDSNIEEIKQGYYLIDALSQPGTLASHTGKEGGRKEEFLNDKQAKEIAYNYLMNWKNQNLGDKHMFNIEYIPSMGRGGGGTKKNKRKQLKFQFSMIVMRKISEMIKLIMYYII